MWLELKIKVWPWFNGLHHRSTLMEERNDNEMVSSVICCKHLNECVNFYFFLSVPVIFPNLPPSRWIYRWIIHESQLCIVWYFIIYVKFWWKVKWRWYWQIPWKETKVSCSCWSECILFRHSSTHSQVKLKTSSTCWKACDLALWPQWATHCLKTAVCKCKEPRIQMNFTYNCKWKKTAEYRLLRCCII